MKLLTDCIVNQLPPFYSSSLSLTKQETARTTTAVYWDAGILSKMMTQHFAPYLTSSHRIAGRWVLQMPPRCFMLMCPDIYDMQRHSSDLTREGMMNLRHGDEPRSHLSILDLPPFLPLPGLLPQVDLDLQSKRHRYFISAAIPRGEPICTALALPGSFLVCVSPCMAVSWPFVCFIGCFNRRFSFVKHKNKWFRIGCYIHGQICSDIKPNY